MMKRIWCPNFVMLLIAVLLALFALALRVHHVFAEQSLRARPAARPGSSEYYLAPEAVKSQVEINTLRLARLDDDLTGYIIAQDRRMHELEKQHTHVLYLLIANLGGLVVTLWNQYRMRPKS